MKKMILAVVGGMMLTATPALAEHKLLITDVLEPKQIEAQAKFEYSHLEGDIRSGELSGKRTINATESLYSLGAGLGHGFEVTASLPYVFSEHVNDTLGDERPEIERRDGVGDFAIEGKYRLLGGEEEPYTVVTGLGLKFDTAGSHVPELSPFVYSHNAGTGTTDVSPFIAASMNLPRHHIPYAIYRATIRNHEAPDTHTISLGLEKEFNHTFTLDAKIDANFNTATRYVNANEDFTFELTTYIQVAHNFYLLPSVSYVVATDSTEKATEERPEAVRVKNLDGFRGGISLYYLF